MSLRRLLPLTLAVVLAALVSLASPASATENPDYTAPPPTTVVTTPQPATKVKTAVAVTPVRTRLAITGSDATDTVLIGVTLVAGGAALLAVRRRRAASL
jgi:LPXTG-motif cell wall-anchored protein